MYEALWEAPDRPCPKDLPPKNTHCSQELAQGGDGLGMSGRFEKSSQGQVPRARDKGVKAFVSQPGAGVAGLWQVCSGTRAAHCNQGDRAR